MDATYRVNDTDFNIIANGHKTTVKVHDGSEREAQFDGSLAGRLLASLALSAATKHRATLESTGLMSRPEDASHIVETLRIIGQLQGSYNRKTISLLELPQTDRSLLITHTQREKPKTSGLITDFELAWRIGADILSGMISRQREGTEHFPEAEDRTLYVKQAERFPGVVVPGDILYSVISTKDDGTEEKEGLLFTPEIVPGEYERVNTAIMQVLKYYLTQPKYIAIDNVFYALDGPKTRLKRP